MFSGTKQLACSGPKGYLKASGAEETAMSNTLADVRLRFPFPPTDCVDAATKIEGLQAALELAQQQLASGASNRVAKRYISATQQVKAVFDQWVIVNKCQAAEEKASDDAFWNQVSGALDKEKAASISNSTADNWIVYGILGILAAGTLVIVFKK